MVVERASRRMTLRQLLTHAEKQTRDLIEQYRATLTVRLTDFRDLSRPVRRRSSYPALVAVQNSLNKLQEALEESMTMLEVLDEVLGDIRERAKREQVSRRVGGD